MSGHPPFVPPGYATVEQAAAKVVNGEGCEPAEALHELRRRLASGQIRASLVHYQTGKLLSIPAQRWHLEKCLPWLQTGKAEITAAEWEVWRNPERGPPICCLYIEQSDRSNGPDLVSSAPAETSDEPASRRAVSDAVSALWGGFEKIPAIPVMHRDRQIIDWLKADRNYSISEKTIGRAFKRRGQF